MLPQVMIITHFESREVLVPFVVHISHQLLRSRDPGWDPFNVVEICELVARV